MSPSPASQAESQERRTEQPPWTWSWWTEGALLQEGMAGCCVEAGDGDPEQPSEGGAGHDGSDKVLTSVLAFQPRCPAWANHLHSQAPLGQPGQCHQASSPAVTAASSPAT